MRPTDSISWRSLTGVLAAVALAWAAGQQVQAEQRAPLRTSHPRHFEQGRADAPGVPLAGQRMSQPRAKTPVLMRSEARLIDEWTYDKGLSKACNEGRLRQRRDRAYVVRLDGRSYGVAVGGRPGLDDPDRLAADGAYYVIQGQGTSNCRVFRYEG